MIVKEVMKGDVSPVAMFIDNHKHPIHDMAVDDDDNSMK